MRGRGLALGLVLAGSLAACSDETTEPTALEPQLARQPTTMIEQVTGTLTGGTFAGTVQITSFALDNGELMASGVLNGVATVGGVATNIVNQTFTTTATLTGRHSKCDVLFLDLGPLNLDLLGLVVDLSQITLNIDAVPGAGNLLGNLLCAVVNLLNNPLANLQGVLNLLDQINNLLG